MIPMKILTMLKAREKEVRAFKKLALQSIYISQEGTKLTGWIRIQMEDVKRKVVLCSPAALRFIGPGDHIDREQRKGVVNKIIAA